MRTLSCLLAFLALLLGRVGAQLDDLHHLGHELAAVRYGEAKAPPVPHAKEVCVAYRIICSAIGHAGVWPALAAGPADTVAIQFQAFIPRAPRVAFLSRAPPAALRS